MTSHSLTAGEADDGQRLDRFLATQLPELSRSRARDLIVEGMVSGANRTIVEPDYRVKPDDMFVVAIPEPVPPEPEPENIELHVLYEDAALIVIDKPVGLVVHPAPGNWSGTLVNALIAHCGESLSGIGGVKRPGIVHRLDKDTSGVMVVAKTDAAHRGLAEQFADHGREGELHRLYLALVWGVPSPRRNTVTTYIGRHATNRTKMAVMKNGGKLAVTDYNVNKILPETLKNQAKPVASLVECTLRTGRTHQIRVHMAHIGHPVISDPLYGTGFRSKTRALPVSVQSAIFPHTRQALHAAELGFLHPTNGKYVHFRSELPNDMLELMNALTKC